MRLALLFSGQGLQTLDHLQSVREMVGNEMSAALENALADFWHTSPDAAAVDLSTNVTAQPFIFGFEMVWWRLLQPHLPVPICAAGYSLGEMAACAAAGLFPDAAGVALCHARATLMDRATDGEVAMLAVSGLPEDRLAAIVEQHGLAIAIRNSPTHFVITGAAAAIGAAMPDCVAAGASKLTPIAVRTPSHTRFLEPASREFAAMLEPYAQGGLAFPVISAVTGKMAFSSEAAVQALSSQLSSMLHWDDALESLLEMRPDVVLEVGPGNALAKMLAERSPDTPVRSVCDFRTPSGVLNWLGRYA